MSAPPNVTCGLWGSSPPSRRWGQIDLPDELLLMRVDAVDEGHAEDLNCLLGTNGRLQGGAFSSVRSICFALPFGVRRGRRGVPLGELAQPVTQANAPTEWPAI